MSKSKSILQSSSDSHRSRLIKAMAEGVEKLQSFEIKPQGVFGSVAKVICGDVTIKSEELDLEFTVDFDDDMEANEAEIIVYNLSSSTIKQLKKGKAISIEAGYTNDTGVLFKGYITRVKTKIDGADKSTTIKCLDNVSNKTIKEKTYASGTKASYILKDLLQRTGTPIAVFKMRRDWTFKDDEKVDGDLMENIKKYSEICGVSTYVNKGKIYSRYIKEGDNISFTLNEDTGLIGSPEEYEEEITAEDYTDTIKGYECEMLLQHRMAAGAIVNLKSLEANGKYRVCSGSHTFNVDECITKVKIY